MPTSRVGVVISVLCKTANQAIEMILTGQIPLEAPSSGQEVVVTDVPEAPDGFWNCNLCTFSNPAVHFKAICFVLTTPLTYAMFLSEPTKM
jgi:hypothetical protein